MNTEQAREIIHNFVVFEGIDGSGRSTQLLKLKKFLHDENKPFFTTYEPSPSPIGNLIREALAGKFSITAETLARLYSADRGEHIYGKEGIIERTSNKQLVISDRYFFSSLAYQGLTCGKDFAATLNKDFPLPELLVFFDLKPELAVKRMTGRHFDIFENLRFQKEVYEAYKNVLSMFADTKMKIVTIDASMSEDEVAQSVKKVFLDNFIK